MKSQIRALILMVGASVAAVVIGYFQQWSADSGKENIGNLTRAVIWALLAYWLAALMTVWRCNSQRSIYYCCLLSGVGGSVAFFLFVHGVDSVTYAWRFRGDRADLSVAQYVYLWAEDFLVRLIVVSVMDSLIAVPIMSVFFFIARYVERWLSAGRE